MKYILALAMCLVCAVPALASGSKPPKMAIADLTRFVQSGDIIFHKSQTEQSMAIRLATNSEYTHCGIILFKGDQAYVFEATRTVSWTPLEEWIRRGRDHHYLILRLKGGLDPAQVAGLMRATPQYEGKPYDFLFQWTDKAIYCSELVWKMYRDIGITLTDLYTFRDYDLNDKEVQRTIKDRYGDGFSLDEKVVAPSDLLKSPLLEIVQNSILR